MTYYLFVDDIRDPLCVNWVKLPKTDDWIIVRNYDEFVERIATLGLPKFVSFDHDLAFEGYAPDERTGYDCAKWLVDHCISLNENVPDFVVHSMNPVGAENIRCYMNNARKHINERAV